MGKFIKSKKYHQINIGVFKTGGGKGWELNIDSLDKRGRVVDTDDTILWGLTKKKALFAAKRRAATAMYERHADIAVVYLWSGPHDTPTRVLTLQYAPKNTPYPWIEM